jgi:DivIVA domain-containing protein
MEVPEFPIVLRGYDRNAVDSFLRKVNQRIKELERRQTREGIVQSALEEVGQETSAILQQAHDSAAEITARSRSQAEGRLERARGEAEQLIADAEERTQRLERETEALWEERIRLIEEIRQMAEDTLAVADDALERVPPPKEVEPEPGPAPEPEAPTRVEAPTEVAESS